MTRYAIHPLDLAALATFISVGDHRPYVEGVFFEQTGGAVATDGHRLLCLWPASRVSEGAPAADADRSAIVPVPKEMAPVLKKSKAADDVAVWEDGVWSVRVGASVSAFTTPRIEANYPDWRRVLPDMDSDPDGEVCFSAKYLKEFGDVAKLLTDNRSSCLKIRTPVSGGPAAIGFAGRDDAFGVLMPMRASAVGAVGRPDWINPSIRPKQEAAK